jgi:hypothetical protein
MLLAGVALSIQKEVAVGADANAPGAFPWAGRIGRIDGKFGHEFLVIHVHAEPCQILYSAV